MIDMHYIQIMEKLTLNAGSEVYARACDWLYQVSGRVGDMLDVQ